MSPRAARTAAPENNHIPWLRCCCNVAPVLPGQCNLAVRTVKPSLLDAIIHERRAPRRLVRRRAADSGLMVHHDPRIVAGTGDLSDAEGHFRPRDIDRLWRGAGSEGKSGRPRLERKPARDRLQK